ncbi:metallophosphoesterase family protein [Hymenobacter sp. GOD-10R]|uniref:metallophosphoesterase family protein n=1 Tax=Hymenobacter sp. GOD-10R TaxID=3093922 RepID=UPI002D775A09|nr:metallophosphoesterase [Hymenobacter sp. GOD-10R]WRQ28651.1 metallophosphoesterase [Hymenobacter sp. GOD-10R]
MISTLLPKLRATILASSAALLLSSCELLEFSPNDVRVTATEQDLTHKNLARLAAQPKPTGGDTLRFVFTTDSQRYYDELDPLVSSINQQRGVAFVLLGGDVSDFGLRREMSWVQEKLNGLHAPYLTVVGNHDLVGNGRTAYQKLFGPLNYTFTYGDTRFILVDTNGREYAFNGQAPNVPWLQQQLADTLEVRRQVTVCHVPPFNEDFDPALKENFARTLAQAPRLVFNLSGHIDKFGESEPYDDGVTYISGYSVQQRHYLLLTLWGKTHYKLEAIAY